MIHPLAAAGGASPRRRSGSRRRVVFLVTAAVVLAAGGALGWALTHPAPLPQASVEAARTALREVHAAAGIDSAQLARVDSLGAVMERLYAAERARLLRLRRPEALAQLARAVAESAQSATKAAADNRARLLVRIGQRTDDLSARLDALRPRIRTMPGDRRLQRVFAGADLSLSQVQRLQRQHELAALPVAVDSAEAAIGRAENLLDRRLARLHDPHLRAQWQALVETTVAATRGGHVAIVIDKLRRRCVLVKDRRKIAQYRAEFGRNGLADKLHAGDGATPEGDYKVTARNAASRYYKALVLNYPNASDLAGYQAARRRGLVPQGRGPGGLIEIHGHGGRESDWTDGCVALRDDDMEALFKVAEVGTPVVIVGAARLPGD
jgi:L,D-peptidoglycan transpeptidase YkuD (ErfK/YbiS/YcfS/YnhG family)